MLCEDPETHEVVVKPRGACPRGYIERIRDRTASEGLTFVIPKVKTRFSDEGEQLLSVSPAPAPYKEDE